MPRSLNGCSTASRAEGLTIRLNTNITEITQNGEGAKVVRTNSEEGRVEETFDKILIAAGRAPNLEGLDLDKIGVRIGRRGIEVNNKLQTRVKNIYAAGDVIGHYLFTHVAAFQAQLLIRNIFFPLSTSITTPLCRGRPFAIRESPDVD